MIQLNYRDARPIYEQVRDGLRHLVVTGALQAGDKLPSVRALASSLAVAVMVNLPVERQKSPLVSGMKTRDLLWSRW